MKPFYLDDADKETLRQIPFLPGKAQQAAHQSLAATIYQKYGIDRRRYFSVQTHPESRFGFVTVDETRVRTEPVKKISKSDQ